MSTTTTDQRRVTPSRTTWRECVRVLAARGLTPADIARLTGLDDGAVQRALGAPAAPPEDRP